MIDQNGPVIIHEYSLQQAIADGALVEIFKNRWGRLSGWKPIVATSHLHSEVTEDDLLGIWNDFVDWKKQVEPGLPEEERLFATTMNGKKVWVVEDGAAYTMLYPQDY